MQQFVMSVMDRFGYVGICFLILLENLIPPIPSEFILPFGGFMTTYTNLSVTGVVFFSTVGSVIGALILYGIGAMLTPTKLTGLWENRVIYLLGFRRQNMEKAMAWFSRKGKKAILFGRCVPIVRSLVSLPAGMAKVSMPLFLLYTGIGSAVWNLLLVSFGALLGASWGAVQKWMEAYSHVTRIGLYLILAAGLVWIIGKRKKTEKNTRP